MKKINRSIAILTTAVVVCWSPIFAEVSDQEADVKNVVEESVPEPARFVTTHCGRFNDNSVEYTATAGETYVRDKNGNPRASIFTYAYTNA